jgi:hypothetical protein
MRKIAFTFVFILFLNHVFGQIETDKGYIGLSLGASIPTGDFGSTDENNQNAGFAKTGTMIDLNFSYLLGKNFGISAMLLGQSNNIDVDALENEANFQIPGINWTYSSDSWSVGGILIGGYASFPIGAKSSFDAHLMIGSLNTTLPSIQITGNFNGITLSSMSESQDDASFGILLGGGFKFNVSKYISILANMDIVGCTAKFENVQTHYSNSTSEYSDITQNISTINFSVGIAYRLGVKVPDRIR